MHWNDTAIVLSARKHGETSAIARVFTHERGVYAGVIRGIHSKANRGIVQPGNIVNAGWQARLSEHIGTFKCELLEANAAHLMQDATRLAALSSICTLIESALPERHPYPKMYGALQAFLATLRDSDDWPEACVKLELSLLAEAGFGLDLSRCAATGATENLIYVSPKSGRAVSRDAGEPYKEKLLKLPGFLLAKHSVQSPLPRSGEGTVRASTAEILAGLRLTGYFLDHWLLSPHHRKLPAARGRLMEMMREFDVCT
ncbi:MAG: DNA repair protein RecO [Pseudomonadota bacterium]|nr:DNA repair protein RecO [Pseudomonadota bacterium]MDE3037314.1 DNA repair protein RecO [Pseudomonadota bacterium]